MTEKKFANEDLEIELTSYIDSKQNVWFRGKGIAEILGYSNSRKALKDHVSQAHKELICWGNGSLCPYQCKPRERGVRARGGDLRTL